MIRQQVLAIKTYCYKLPNLKSISEFEACYINAFLTDLPWLNVSPLKSRYLRFERIKLMKCHARKAPIGSRFLEVCFEGFFWPPSVLKTDRETPGYKVRNNRLTSGLIIGDGESFSGCFKSRFPRKSRLLIAQSNFLSLIGVNRKVLMVLRYPSCIPFVVFGMYHGQQRFTVSLSVVIFST